MGNWRTVQIIGTCDRKEVRKLRNQLYAGADYENFHCLSFTDNPSLCGLNDWSGTDINVIGNLSERDYDVKDVAEIMKAIARKVPSLSLKIHCGADYEDTTCIDTITVENGEVSIGDAEIDTIPEIPQSQIKNNFFRNII